MLLGGGDDPGRGIFVNIWGLGRKIAGFDRLSETSSMGFLGWDYGRLWVVWVVYIVFC